MLENGSTLSAEGRLYTIISTLGRGATTVAYFAECRSRELVSNCILKGFSPQNSDDFEAAKARFIAAGKMQNDIRRRSALANQTPPVSRIFETNGIAYIDVACYNGTALDKLGGLTLPQYMAICETIAKTVEYYHKSGYICLDLKPENIFVLQNSPDDTITQLVEFIDFDSIRESGGGNALFSYTQEWAAPEQLNPYPVGRVGRAADIYTVGEMVFYLLFGRHSTDSEHRGFSKYPFEECSRAYRRYTERPDVQAVFTKIFRGTVRSSAINRFGDIGEVVGLLGELVEILIQKDFIIPTLPSVSPDFVGRVSELRQIAENLQKNPVLYLTGVGGIGKSALIKNYIARYKAEYEVVVYLEFDGDIRHTFCDDMQLQLSTVSRQDGEAQQKYFVRKLKAFKRICGEKRVLFVLDNFSGKVTKDLSRMIDCGYDVIIASRNRPPKNSFPMLEIGAINDISELFRLIELDLERTPTKEEQHCFEEIITLVQGHTLVLELIARQIAAGRLDVHTALELIHENGFSRFSGAKISSYKDGEEIYGTLSTIISALFDASEMSGRSRLALKVFALLNVRGLEASLVREFFPEIESETIAELSDDGWLYDGGRIRLHPVIAETVRGWKWTADDVTVMDLHKKVIDIYVGMSNCMQIKEILREADIFKELHPRHIITAMYCDMVGSYYDTLADGNYIPYTKEEAGVLRNLLDAMYTAAEEMELSSDPRKTRYLAKYYLSLTSVLIRSCPEYYGEAAALLGKVSKTAKKDSADYCYFCMASAWYFTLAAPDFKKTVAYTKEAERVAERVFKTELELIDVIHIPTANCLYCHNDFHSAADKIWEAVEICRRHPDMPTYISKRAELLKILTDIYLALEDIPKCRELAAEIDRINEKYKDQGVCCELDKEVRRRI